MSRIAIGVSGTADPITLRSDQPVDTPIGTIEASDLESFIRHQPDAWFRTATLMAIHRTDEAEWTDPNEVAGTMWVKCESVTFIAEEAD